MSTGPVPILAAVEGGGTTFVLTIASLGSEEAEEVSSSGIPHTPFRILHQVSLPSSTKTPNEVLSEAAHFFRVHYPTQGYAGLGIATFGPVGLDSNDPSFGQILKGSPKKEWREIDILGPILRACSSEDGSRKPPYRIDTDVNAPAMAEFSFEKRSSPSITSMAYVTVGTGVGVGLVINSKPVHGMMHPEGGHVPIIPLNGDSFGYSWGSKSPFRGKDTIEGTASSVALTERLSNSTSANASQRDGLKDLSDDHPIWDHAANALANLCVTLTLVTSVEKIVFGGGVMNRTILYDKIRQKFKELLNGYLDLKQVSTKEGLENYIAPSVWTESDGGVGSGLVGALVLAQFAYNEDSTKESS